MGMIDVGAKPVIEREAEAGGVIYLRAETVAAIRRGEIRKGDPLPVAEVAGMTAAKQTHLLVPHCHQLLLETVSVRFDVKDRSVEARCLVRAEAKTGVEMEALVGVAMALNTIWDMVKYLEKDPQGQYPETRIDDIRVLWKKKG